MKLFYKTVIFSLLIACDQIDASNFKHTEFKGFLQQQTDEKLNLRRNKLHEDVARLDRAAILTLIYSGIDLNEIFNDKNENGDTPYDQAKKGAMNRYWFVETRKEFYKICNIFNDNNAPSSIKLTPQPSDAIMKSEYEQAMNNIVTLKPHLYTKK